MVIPRPAVLVLAGAFGIMLGMPAVTSPPTGFVSSAEQAASTAPAGGSAPALSVTAPVVSSPAMQIPPPPVLMALLRGTLAAINQANVTGNYSVLRDLGAPAFRENYNAAQLADRFRPWRDNALDFAAILLLDAKLSRAPVIDERGLLRLAGYFPTQPLRIGFDLGFQAVDGNWRLSTISVDARTDETASGEVAKAPPKAANTSVVTAGPVAAKPARVLAEKAAVVQPKPSAAPASSRQPAKPAPFSMQP